MNSDDVQLVLGLRLLIARAANSDSLAWWDDQSLTGPASFVMERTFPVAPVEAARSLALRSASARHWAVCPSDGHTLHLFRLDPDNQDQLELRFASLTDLPVPVDPIQTIDQLAHFLTALTAAPLPSSVVRQGALGTVQIAIPPCPAGTAPIVHRAKALAWAYLAGSRGQPAIPYLVERPS